MSYTVIVQIAVPLLLVVVIAIGRQPSRLRWLGTVVSFGMVVSYLLISSRWDVASLYLRAAIPVLFIAAAIVAYRRIHPPEAAPGKLQALIPWTINLALIVLMSGFLWFSLGGYRTPDGAVDLASPLRGAHVVLNGGGSPFTNAHFRVRPQNHALDVVGLNAFGTRASLFGDGEDLESYAIYGDPVFSPCDGRIGVAVDNLPDLTPPEGDGESPAGNHVLIECGEFEVLLAHLRRDSVRVSVGEVVTAGDRLGEVGNSGNTSEPHLHIHAERGGRPGVILDGEAVPITIEGRFLVRNSILRSSPSERVDPATAVAVERRREQLRDRLRSSLGDRYDAPLPAGAIDEIRRGAKLYDSICRACHGATGNGNGKSARMLANQPPNLSDPSTASFFSDQAKLRIIAEGIPDTPMIGWDHMLEEDEQLAVLHFMNTLVREPASP